MSLENKGTVANRVLVTSEPDRSGNLICNGASDETEINLAFTYLTSARTWKETVKLIGDFTIDGVIAVPSYTILDLTEANIFLANDSDCNIIENSDTVSGNTHLEIIGGMLDGNKANNAATSIGVFMEGVSYGRIIEMTIVDMNDEGISLRETPQCTYMLVQGNTIIDPDVVGIRLFNLYYGRVIGNNVSNPGTVGIEVRVTTHYSTIAHNYIEDATIGIHCQQAGENNIVGNHIKDSTVGIQLTDEDWDAFTGNTMDGVAQGGFIIDADSTYNTIGENFMQGGFNPNTWDGITVLGDYNTVSSNTFAAPAGGWGFRDGVRVTGDYNVVESNIINLSGTDGIYVDGDFNIISNNSVFDNVQDGIEINGGSQNLVVGNMVTTSGAYGIVVDNAALENQIQNNYTDASATAGMRIGNANCLRNIITGNCFDEGAISDVGGGHLCVAYLNYDPSAGAMIATINAPTVVGGGGGALP